MDGARLVIDPGLLVERAILIENGETRTATMGIATHSIMRPSCTPLTCLLSRDESGGRCSASICSTCWRRLLRFRTAHPRQRGSGRTIRLLSPPERTSVCFRTGPERGSYDKSSKFHKSQGEYRSRFDRSTHLWSEYRAYGSAGTGRPGRGTGVQGSTG